MTTMDRPVMVASGLRSPLGQALLAQLGSDWEVLALGREPVAHQGVTWLRADFRQPQETWRRDLSDWLERRGKPVQALVHAAGTVFSTPLELTTADELKSTLTVNLASALQMGQTVSPHFAPGGRVVLVGSVDARYASQDGAAAAYGAAKAGLEGLARHWAAEWGERQICVNVVAPGALQGGMGPADDATAERLRERIALGRLGRPEEAAAAIAFLLSPGAAYITGTTIAVDGGLNLTY